MGILYSPVLRHMEAMAWDWRAAAAAANVRLIAVIATTAAIATAAAVETDWQL